MRFNHQLAIPLVLVGAVLFGAAHLQANGNLALSAGDSHVLIIGESNSLWGWGGNAFGQVGNDSKTDVLIPARITDTNDWQYVSAGSTHSAAIKLNGTLWTWGQNDKGQLGDGTGEDQLVPVRVGNDADWSSVSAGDGYTLALKADGSLWGFGDNTLSQLAQASGDLSFSLVPVRIDASNSYSAMSAGQGHVLAIRTNGSLFGWGNNGAGQLGLGITSQRPIVIPKQIGSASDWSYVDAADIASHAINNSGALFSWGVGGGGQLGLGNLTSRTVPTQVGVNTDWVMVSASSSHSLGITTNGGMWGWGLNGNGELGLPLFDEFENFISGNIYRTEPVQIATGSAWNITAAGDFFSLAQGADGVVFSTGRNDNGQLGNGTTLARDGFSGSFFGIPDLAIPEIGIVTDAEQVVQGGAIDVNLFVFNQGTAAIPAGQGIRLDVRFSKDQEFSSDDIPLSTVSGAPIIIDEAIGSTLNITLPLKLQLPATINAGAYFIVAAVDTTDVIEETLEDNNEGFSSETLEFFPNLVIDIDDSSIATGPFLGGDSFNVTFTVNNSGSGNLVAGPGDAFEIRFWLSVNDFPGDAGDVVLLESLLLNDGIDTNTPITRTENLLIPVYMPIGSYRVIAKVDVEDNVVEIDEEDNVDFTQAQLITVEGLDLVDVLDNPVLERNGEGGIPESIELEFETVGESYWFGQGIQFATSDDDPVVPPDNDSSAQSAPLEVGQQSYIETLVPGPSRITFMWSIDAGGNNNYLKFTIDGAEPVENGRISGIVPFTKASFILPGAENQVRWTYVQGAEGDGSDTSWIDNITVIPLTGFDLLIDSVGFTPGVYVPQFDKIQVTVLARNQGARLAPSDLPPEFSVAVVLSLDRTLGNEDDIILGNLAPFTDGLQEDDRFGYSTIFDVPKMITRNEEEIIVPGGAYYLLVQVDSSNLINESDEENNTFLSDEPSIVIDPRPDIRPVSLDFAFDWPDPLTDPEPALILHGDKITVGFSLNNEGLADVQIDPETGQPIPFEINIVLSANRIFGEENDFVLLAVTEPSGLPINRLRNYEFEITIPPNTPVGDYFYMGLVVDPSEVVTESIESNNSLGSDDRNLLFAEVRLEQAVGSVEDGFPIDIDNDLEELDAPFFGQTTISFDGEAAAESAEIQPGETAGFEFDIVNAPGETSVISFAWRVSSERRFIGIVDEEVLKEDALIFYIDGVEQKRISGLRDWLVESFEIESGTHTVRWEYSKDFTDSFGLDAGWVDEIRTDSPNLEFVPEGGGVSLLTAVPPGGFTSGGDIQVGLKFVNNGQADVRSTPPFSIQIRISPDPQWDELDTTIRNDFILDNFQVTTGVTQGEVVTLTRNLQIPLNIAIADDYYILARLDEQNDVPESLEGANNDGFTSSAILKIQPTINLDEALDFAAPFGWVTGGDSTWFGQNDEVVNMGGNLSAGQSSPILSGQETFLKTTVIGPAVVSFYWKVSSIQNSNLLRFKVSDVEQARISGDMDWHEVSFFVPSGDQVLEWNYAKQVNQDEEGILDTAWVDLVTLTPVTLPDLKIASILATEGQYILDRQDDSDRDKLPITVVAENRGADLPAGTVFAPSDINIRLSADRIFGNEDDIILGEFSRLEINQANDQIIFDGEILLPLSTPSGNYFVAAYIDFFERLEEYQPDDFERYTLTDNNLAFIEDRSINVKRTADLVIENVVYDNSRVYFGDDTLTLNFKIRNRGLEPTQGNIVFNQRIRMFATGLFTTITDDGGLENDAARVASILVGDEVVDELSNFPINTFLPGVDEFHPNGGTLQLKMELVLPPQRALELALGAGGFINVELFSFYLVIDVDLNNSIEESDEQNTYIYGVPFFINSTPTSSETFNDWRNRYDLDSVVPVIPNVDTAKRDTDGDGLKDLEEYALNFNPLRFDSGNHLSSYAMILENGTEYFGLNFHINKYASDLSYTVLISNDGIFFTPLILFEPPYLDDHGANSLTGIGGLLDNVLVTDVVDLGYHARLSVRDNIPVLDLTSRFMKLKISKTTN